MLRADSQLGHDKLCHELFVYDDDHAFVERTAPFLKAGIEELAATILVTTPGRWSGVREALGSDAQQVRFLDRDDVYVHPAATVAGYERTLCDEARSGGRTTRLLAELAVGPDDAEWDRWMVYEAVVNRALADHDLWVVCGYDAREVPDRILDTALRNHPGHFGDEDVAGSSHYEDPSALIPSISPAPLPVDGLRDLGVFADASVVRDAIAPVIGAALLPPSRATELLLAVNEVATNAFTHGAAPVTARAGLIGGRLVVEISDSGQGFEHSLAGWLPPRTGSGSGLWVARQLTSRLEFISADGGLTVRLWQ